jgi:hypothetical protein
MSLEDLHRPLAHQRGAPKYFSIPFERIEALHPPLRFQVPLGRDGNGKVRFEWPQSRVPVQEHQS